MFAGEAEIEFPLIADIKHLSDLLGLGHDAAELSNWLHARTEADPAGELKMLFEDVRRFRIDHEGAARPHGRAIFNGAAAALVRHLSGPYT